MNDLEHRITKALERAPDLSIPSDFAKRVAAHIRPRPAAPALPQRHFTRNTVVAALSILIVAMLIFLPSVTHLAVAVPVEYSLVAEFVGLIVFISLRPRALR